VTGNADCQRLFRDGVLALHSFLYDQAHESFVAAAAADPACTMAYWGDAMSFDHPVWHERDLAKGRAALAKVAHDEALTPKERAYLGVARALYAKDDLKAAHEAWLVAAAKMHGDFADDDEVALQHALALIAVHGYDRDHVREQMEAGTIALEVLHRNPSHPGAAHYAIHAFDSREHAILALEAAKTYAAIAPAGGHAQHMPSHTFVHLGMWREVVPSNEKAWASSVAWEKARGHSAGKYDWHSYSWLVAANLELGHVARAKQLIDDARALVLATKDDAADMRAALVDMVADYALTTGRWSEVESLVAPVFTPVADEGGPGGAVACAAHAPGAGGEVRMPEALIARIDANNLRAQAAIHAGDEATAKARVADMVAVEKQMGPWSSMLSPSTRARWEARDAALLARAHAGPKARPADVKRAIDAIEKHMNAEELRPIAGPAFYEPPREALGNALLAAGRAKDAVAVFEREIEQRPNRALALLGAARAAKAAGDGATARAHYATLVELWRDADVGFDLVAEARDGAK
jgi:tetratricopeptide (TPR) repeat protein